MDASKPVIGEAEHAAALQFIASFTAEVTELRKQQPAAHAKQGNVDVVLAFAVCICVVVLCHRPHINQGHDGIQEQDKGPCSNQ